MGNEQPSAPKPKALNPSELQTYLMVTQVKLNQGRNKKIALIKKKEGEIIKHLNENNLDIAKAKMESLIREEDFITVYDILGPLCEILKEKVTYIMTSKECPSDLRASMDTLIYSSTRLEIEELHFIREFIKQKYTNIYVDKANSNIDKLVNMNVVEKLTVKPASEAELINRLKAICERENIEFSFPQLNNPLVIDANMNSGSNAFIPNMPNIPNNNYNNYNNPNNNNNMNFNNYNNSGYGMPISNNIQQGQYSQGSFGMQGQTQFPGQYTGNINTDTNLNNMQNFNNPNFNPYESNALNFTNVPNNFSNIPNNQQPINYNASQYPNNNNNFNNQNQTAQNINNTNDLNKQSGFPSMPNADSNFPQQGKIDMPMMSGGFAPMGNINSGQTNASQTFPTVQNPNFDSVNDLDFPSKK